MECAHLGCRMGAGGCVGSVDVSCIPTYTYKHTHSTHTSRIDMSIDVRTCVLCVYVL